LPLGLVAIGLIGCDDDAEPTAEVRVLHLSPDAPAVDVVVDDATPAAVTSLAYKSATPYLTLPAGPHDFSVRAAGTTTVALALNDLTLAEGQRYTAVAWGEGGVMPALIDDSLEGLAAGSLRVNVIHAADGVGQVDVWNVPESGAPTPLITDFDEGEQDQLDLPAAAYRVGIDVNDDASPDLLFQLPALPAGQVVDLFAVKDADSVYLVALLESGGTATINPLP